MEAPYAHSGTLDECEAVWVPGTHAHWEWSEMVEVVLFDLLPHPVHPGAVEAITPAGSGGVPG
ncbi:hypothetical protein [Actinomyces sp. HMT897]|uniref:hypothetical protein n=1 Tax=Actinomyces sp. HMT897 TaxID=2789424 RepID=UPI000D0353E9|nr:hypothetical protein [Actinomyces sp. HMT897]AVM60810.1 hypothetical protein C3V41_00495 [Actinomyces sp. oral taxon 897]QQO77487.1 hypothetical protein JJJ15_10720 [Actinomyces sp. HMT897]